MGNIQKSVVNLINDSERNRFWSKVAITANDNLCWNWISGKVEGYGSFTINKKSYRANRIAYLDFYKINPNNLCVLHKCDNPSCVNPKHLFLGTRGDNNKDCNIKGRKFITNGVKNGMSKLTKEDVIKLFDLFNTGEYTKSKLSTIFNITTSCVASILNGDRWKYLNQKSLISKRIKLNKDDVIKIRELYTLGNNYNEISSLYNITKDAVYRIVSKKSWANI